MAFTYFFRDLHTLEGAVKYIVPQTAGRSHIAVWDAGCAMGPEPYSLAILFSENMGHFAFRNLAITGSDIDTSNLFATIISAGVYPEQELSRIPKPLFKKYFTKTATPGEYRIDDKIRKCLRFQRHDLLTLKPAGKDFSLILCKNVLLHLQPEERVEVIKMFHDVLLPNGVLAMEQTQTLPAKLSYRFEQVRTDMQLFRKKAA